MPSASRTMSHSQTAHYSKSDQHGKSNKMPQERERSSPETAPLQHDQRLVYTKNALIATPCLYYFPCKDSDTPRTSFHAFRGNV